MNARTQADDIARFLESGEHDPVFGSRPGATVVDQVEAGNAALWGALEAELRAREAKVARRPRLSQLQGFDEQERDALLAAPASRLKELTRHRGLSVNKLMARASL